MYKCLYCYKDLGENQVDYHQKCIVFGTKNAPDLPYRLADMEKLAKEAAKLSKTVTQSHSIGG